MFFEGNSCPECGLVFADGDDIVVCPECGTPHHRECWRARGGVCRNAELHGTDYVWQSQKPAEPPPGDEEEKPAETGALVCTYCGESNPSDALSCFSCGAPILRRPGGKPFGRTLELDEQIFMRGIGCPPDTKIDGMSVRDAAMYVQQSAPRYIAKFLRSSEGGRLGWNWAAFAFSPYWFFYRKLYKVGALFLALALAFSLFVSPYLSRAYGKYENVAAELSGLTDESQITDEQSGRLNEAMDGLTKVFAVTVAGDCLIGAAAALTADGIYKKRVRGDVERLRKISESENVFVALVLRKGGVSYLATVASILGLRLAVQLLSSIAQGL